MDRREAPVVLGDGRCEVPDSPCYEACDAGLLLCTGRHDVGQFLRVDRGDVGQARRCGMGDTARV
ncbi:hypothetical protein HAX54_042916, partial [Datura stramonium]|nr:hypothetical protein [Datura stramonium]